MANGNASVRRCSYVVCVDRPAVSIGAARTLSEYLSTLAVAGCDVVIADQSPAEVFREHRRVFRWVGRHVSVPRGIDPVRAAIEVAACDNVIVATEDFRYSAADVETMCQLLDAHEVVEPQQYLSPLPWWGGIEVGSMLVQRGLGRSGSRSLTYALRRSGVRAIRSASVHAADDVFVRRMAPALSEWLRDRTREADDDFAVPVRSVLFLALLPIAASLALLGGLRAAGGFAGALAFAATVLALRGRIGATAFYPLRACLLAPVWVLERSISVHWALFRRLHRAGIRENVTTETQRSARHAVPNAFNASDSVS